MRYSGPNIYSYLDMGDRITEALNYTFIKYKYKDDIQYLSSSKDKLVKSLDLAGLVCQNAAICLFNRETK